MSPRAAGRLETLGFHRIYEYSAGKADWAASGLPLEGTTQPRIGDIARKAVPIASLTETTDVVAKRMRDGGWNTAFVVNERGVVLGRVSDQQVANGARPVSDVMKGGPSTFRPNVPLEEMHEYMTRHDLKTAPVTTSGGLLVGLVLIEDLERRLAEVKGRRH